MATPVKVGARNDVYCLTQARQHTNAAEQTARGIVIELKHMRAAMGRPDYGPISTMIAELAISLAQSSKHLEEMASIRAQAKDGDAGALTDRIAQLEAQIHQIAQRMERITT